MKISQSGIPWSSSANVNCRPPGSFSPHALWKSAMLCPITAKTFTLKRIPLDIRPVVEG